VGPGPDRRRRDHRRRSAARSSTRWRSPTRSRARPPGRRLPRRDGPTGKLVR
jgi:hypothetical protein